MLPTDQPDETNSTPSFCSMATTATSSDDPGPPWDVSFRHVSVTKTGYRSSAAIHPDTKEDAFPSVDEEDFLSLDADYASLFGGIKKSDITDEDLLSLPMNDGDTHDHSAIGALYAIEYNNLEARRDKLIIVKGLINGYLATIMVDTGFTAGVIMDTTAAERCGIRPHRHPKTDAVACQDVMVGDGRKIQAHVSMGVPINLDGYKSCHDTLIMPLGGKFDAAVGMNFFRTLQARCEGDIGVNFITNRITFHIKTAGKKRRHVIDPSAPLPAHMIMAPTSCPAHLNSMLHKCKSADVLPAGTRILRFDDNLNLMRTNWDDDWLEHDPTLPDPRPPQPQEQPHPQEQPPPEGHHVLQEWQVHPYGYNPSFQGETDGVTATVNEYPRLPGCLKDETLNSSTEPFSIPGDQEETSAPPQPQEQPHPQEQPPPHPPQAPPPQSQLNIFNSHPPTPSKPLTDSGRGTTCASLSASRRGGIGEPSPSTSRPDNDDDFDGTKLVEKAVRDQDKNNLIPPKPNPNWRPEMPNESDSFSDPDFMERVDVRANTTEQLKELERSVGVDFVDRVLKRNGQVFRDDVPTAMVPDRGPWNGTIDFVNPADALRPICKKPYRLSPDETKALAQNLRDLLLRGTITPSNSPWGTPVFLVPKADGGWRMACDYRDLNAKLVKEAYCPPAADQLFDQLQSARFFSSHDCTWGFHQLRWSQDSIPKTAIRTNLGTFEFLVVNFGSTSAPAQWTRLMEAILRPYLGKFAVIFLDDLCVFSDTAEEHAEHLDLVYRALAKNKIYLRFGKCYFFTRKFKFLGWIIEEGKLTPDPEKISALKGWPLPTCKRDVRSFTGFCNFYKRFVKDYAHRISPLHDLQRDEVPDTVKGFAEQECWKEEHTAAFHDIIDALTTAPAVSIVNPLLKYELEVDASQVAVGGILSQIDDSGKKTVIEYYSRRLSQTQRNYAPGKLELLALIVCLEHWRHYLKGARHQFVIHTDHEPLLAIRSTKNPTRMLLRWLNFIEQFNFEVRYRKGKENPSDMLSRPPDPVPEQAPPPDGIKVSDCDNAPDDEPPDLSHVDVFSLAWLSEACEAPDDFHLISDGFAAIDDDFLSEHVSPASLQRLKLASAGDPLFQAVLKNPRDFKGKFRLQDDLLWWIKKGHTALFIPASCVALRKAIFLQHHGHITAGHFGGQRTASKILQHYWWPNLHREVAEWVSQCSTCLTTKRKKVLPMRMTAHDVPEQPWDVVFMDEVSGFPESGGFTAIWVFMDKLSKMVHFVPVTKLGLGSEELGELFFTHVFRLHGLPRIVVSDRDARMTDEFWRTLFRLAGVKLNMSTPMHPQTDSSGEAAVKICIDLCRQYVNSNRDDWAELLPALEFAYNSTPGVSGHSPFEIDGLRQPRSAQTLLIDSTLSTSTPTSGRAELSTRLLSRYNEVIKSARRALKLVADRVGAPERTVTHKTRDDQYAVGDRVFLRREHAGTSFPQDKMSKLYVGPFEIEEVVSDKSYKLDLPSSMRVSKVQNIDNLWKPGPGFSVPPPDAIETGAPEDKLPRLTAEPIIIDRLFFETLEDETIEVFAQTPLGKYTLHDLCVHQHFEECAEALTNSHNTIVKWPYHLGRAISQTFWREPGFVSAYDPNDPAKAYQLEFRDPSDSYWAPREDFTIKRRPQQALVAAMTPHPPRPRTRPPRVLELCCGSKSFTKVFAKMFPHAELVTLDISNSFKPDIVADITTWDYLSAFSRGYFDIIWVSPPCTEYSPAKAGSPRDLDAADRIVLAALHIIAVARPRVWFLENPHTMLYKRTFMITLELLRVLLHYCKYGYPYKKPTDLWSNIPLQLLNCDVSPCPARAMTGVHSRTAQQGKSGRHDTPGVPAHLANTIPPALVRVLISHARQFLTSMHCDERIKWN